MVPIAADHHRQSTTIPASAASSNNGGGSGMNNLKKTRDLPNLSQCHACGFRVDTCKTPATAAAANNNRIQALYSEWRIVLLCCSCAARVSASQICSYCFKPQGGGGGEGGENGNFLRCRQCNRSVHESCFLNYKAIAPWSYCCLGSKEFRVCVDCWVPRYIESERLTSSGRSDKRKEKRLPLEDVIKEASSSMEKKLEVAARARDLAIRKAILARTAADLLASEGEAFDLVATHDDGGGGGGVMEGCFHDDELAFQLHRAMNSSPRLSKNLRPLNSSCLGIGRTKERGSERSCLGVRRLDAGNSGDCGELELCNGKRDASEPLLHVRTSKRVGDGRIVMMRGDGSGDAQPREGEMSHSDRLLDAIENDNSANSESQCCILEDESSPSEDERYYGRPNSSCLIKFSRSRDPDPWLIKFSRSRKPDHYLLKYSRRKLNERSTPDGKSKFLYEGLHPEIGIQASATGQQLSCSPSTELADTLLPSCSFSLQECTSKLLKYRRIKFGKRSALDGEPKFLYEGLHPEIQASPNEQLLSCSTSTERYDFSPQSCNSSPQACPPKLMIYGRKKLNEISTPNSKREFLYEGLHPEV